jgi:seryl-tRNA synthetase
MENDEMVKTLTEVDERSKSNTHRLDAVEKRQGELDRLVSTVAVIATKQQTIEDDVKEIKTDVKALSEKPVKRWDGAVDKIIMTVLGAIIIYILAQIGL